MPVRNTFRPSSDTITVELPALHAEQQFLKDNAKRFNVLCCGRRFGKTTMAITILGENALNGQPCAYFAPTYRMLAEVWREFLKVFRPIIAEKVEDEHYVRLITGGRVDFWSLENEDAARGRFYKVVVIDEAAVVANLMDIWEMVIRPTLIDLKGSAWFMSTPKGRNGFHKLHLLGRDADNAEWQSWVRTSYDNPYIPASELESLRAEQSELAFRQEIMAEFLEDSGTVFRHLEEACVLDVSTPDQHHGHTLVMGLDWGKQNDFTVASIMCATCAKETYIDRFNEIDYFFQRQRIQQMALNWRVKYIEVELNAMGQPLFEELQRLGLPVYGFKTTATSKSPLIEGFSLGIERGDVQLLKYPTGLAELEAYERKVNPITNRATYSAPRDFHDDTVIARALAYKRMVQASILERNRRFGTWTPPAYNQKGF